MISMKSRFSQILQNEKAWVRGVDFRKVKVRRIWRDVVCMLDVVIGIGITMKDAWCGFSKMKRIEKFVTLVT